MLPQEFIRLKRDGHPLPKDAIARFVRGIVDGSVGEGQMAAFAMAAFLQGMTRDETVALTEAMRDSGTVLDWNAVIGGDAPVLDKHSTGGVGDNVSLMLAPALAACGAVVPMISGRGLGHTGGTLDKLDAVPGYQTQPDADTFRRVAREVGCAVIGQTGDLAPADKRLYAVRDVTATVESVPLITASILSKKLAAGLGALVLDVKCGGGAFMADLERARELAVSLVEVAGGAGLPARAVVTDMNEPLASAAGNALEVANAIDFLSGREVDPRLWDVTVALGAEMLVLGGLARDAAHGAERMGEVFASGAAAERFARMVRALGGPGDLLDKPERHLPRAPVVRRVEAEGTVLAVDARAVGLVVVELGGGRTRAQDPVDPAVGLNELAPIGQPLDGNGAPLAVIHARSEDAADRAEAALRAAYSLGDAREVEDRPTVIERVG